MISCNQFWNIQGIKRNHDRAAELKEDSILPDLVATHRDTLRSMKANHTNLRSCRQLCTQSKKELCDIIHKRLKYVFNVVHFSQTYMRICRLTFCLRVQGYHEYTGASGRNTFDVDTAWCLLERHTSVHRTDPAVAYDSKKLPSCGIRSSETTIVLPSFSHGEFTYV